MPSGPSPCLSGPPSVARNKPRSRPVAVTQRTSAASPLPAGSSGAATPGGVGPYHWGARLELPLNGARTPMSRGTYEPPRSKQVVWHQGTWILSHLAACGPSHEVGTKEIEYWLSWPADAQVTGGSGSNYLSTASLVLLRLPSSNLTTDSFGLSGVK